MSLQISSFEQMPEGRGEGRWGEGVVVQIPEKSLQIYTGQICEILSEMRLWPVGGGGAFGETPDIYQKWRAQASLKINTNPFLIPDSEPS